MPRLAPLLLPAAALLLAACCPPPGAGFVLRAEDYPGALHPPSALGPDFMWRQRLTARFGDREESFEAVLQKVGDELVLLGLTPFGSKAFVLRQAGGETELTSFVDREMPFPARFVLIDVHRVYVALAPDAPPEGEHRFERDGEEVVEVRRAGRLIERRFRRLDGQPPGVITVRYQRWSDDGLDPLEVELDNGWFGYRLSVSTVERTAL